jgi:hypothetical protein
MVEQELVQMYRCTCDLCGHIWTSSGKPLRCAACKSPYWNKKPVNTNSVPAEALKEQPIVKGTNHAETCTCILCLLRGKKN